MFNKEKIASAKRIIIKIGTNTVLNQNYEFNFKFFNSLSYEIKTLQQTGKEIIIVSSGSIGLGNSILNQKKTTSLVESQCAAAVGQGALMNFYAQCFKSVDITVSQVLLTYDDLKNSERNKNIKDLFEFMLSHNIVPIINENDSVATEEITFGDNDVLSSLVANLVSADLLILLSNVDGVYSCFKSKKRISFLDVSKTESASLLNPEKSTLGKGGMQSKFLAAKQAAKSNTLTVVANGLAERVLSKITSGDDIGTILFNSQGKEITHA